MLRLWLSRRWIIGTLVAIVFAVACFFLGRWQWGRHEEKLTKATAIAQNYGAPPVPLATALSKGPLTPEREWTHVTFTGTYAAGADLLVRNRTLDQTVGFEVLTPFTTDGTTLLLDRGWVPNADDAETTPPVDPPATGDVTVTGWLRTGEPSLGRDLPRPQLASISIADARLQQPSVGPADVYVVVGGQSPAPARGEHPLALLPRPEESLGPHQAYAYQWWLTMPAGLVFVVWAMRRELAAGSVQGGGVQGGGVQGGVQGRDALPARKPKKVRIWDEEDA